VVAPFIGAEQQLYTDLGTLLPARRAQLRAITAALAQAERERRQAACRLIASTLIDVAAQRRGLPADEFADPRRQQAFVRDFQGQVGRHARRAVDELLALYAFRADDAELAQLPLPDGRWEDDLFNPELLLQAGKRLGLGAMIGAGVGAVADVALAGLSLGAATTLGATVGGAVSGGWRPLWRKLQNRIDGVQELTVEDAVLGLLAERLLRLARALARRGHAAQQRLRVGDDGPGAAADGQRLVDALDAARGHPEWERGSPGAVDDADRAQLLESLAAALRPRLEPDTAVPIGA